MSCSVLKLAETIQRNGSIITTATGDQQRMT